MTRDQAIALALRAHAGQLDQRGASYFLHPMRVMRRVPEEAKLAAILHDVIERSATTLDDLAAAGLDATNVAAVDLLTRAPAGATERPEYDDYIARIARASGDEGRIARTVKIADLEDKLARLPSRHAHRAPRYHRALATLRGSDRRAAFADAFAL